jgi:hypothetical protein
MLLLQVHEQEFGSDSASGWVNGTFYLLNFYPFMGQSSGNYSILPERQPIHGQPINISSATIHWSWTSFFTTATQV